MTASSVKPISIQNARTSSMGPSMPAGGPHRVKSPLTRPAGDGLSVGVQRASEFAGGEHRL